MLAMNLLELLAMNLALTVGLMLLLWLVSLALRDVSIVDVFWGMGFIVIAAVTFAFNGQRTDRGILLLFLIAAWGLRLSIYLGRRKFGAPEDHRYQAMRDSIGPRFWIVSLFLVFGLQAIIMNVVALPILTGQLDTSSLTWLNVAGCLVWLVGFLFETVGDWQLARFKSDPGSKGKVLDGGLWRYTRHPNYFGDFMVWWGIYFVSLGDGATWWTVVSPLLMSLLLMRVSGVTLLERTLRERRAGYSEYVARTSTFFPWPPRVSSTKVLPPEQNRSGGLRQWLALLLFLAICLSTAALGAAWTDLSVGDWYATLNKPSWNPPNWLFGPVWTTLYIGMAVAAWLVWRRKGVADAWLPLLLFGVQLTLNAIWSGLFFGMRNPGIAFVEVVFLWLAIVATIVSFARISRPAALLLAPYLAWVSFASFLNWTIWQLNA
jgi:steroid 5-alpha reductase family enzyme/tryptophan-rich sensory protein